MSEDSTESTISSMLMGLKDKSMNEDDDGEETTFREKFLSKLSGLTGWTTIASHYNGGIPCPECGKKEFLFTHIPGIMGREPLIYVKADPDNQLHVYACLGNDAAYELDSSCPVECFCCGEEWNDVSKFAEGVLRMQYDKYCAENQEKLS